MNETKQYVSVGEASKHFGVSTDTIRRWCNRNTIQYITTKTNHRRINLLSNRHVQNECFKKNICYCRVSTTKQRDDLERQINFMVDKFPGYTIIKDVGSGLNFKRKGLLSILEQCKKGLVQSVTITSKDRLCRFGFELLEWFFKQENVQLVVLHKEDITPEQELTRDILSIMQVFNARWNGKRRYKVIDEVSKDQIKGTTSSKIIMEKME